jgi:hypothetical protein
MNIGTADTRIEPGFFAKMDSLIAFRRGAKRLAGGGHKHPEQLRISMSDDSTG